MKAAEPTIIPEEEYIRNLKRVKRDLQDMRFDQIFRDEGLAARLGWDRNIPPTFKNFIDLTLPEVNYRNEVQEVRALEGLENFLATYVSFNHILSDTILLKKRMQKAEIKQPADDVQLTQREKELINIISVYAGANSAKLGIEEFTKEDNSVKGTTDINFSLEKPEIIKQIAMKFCVGMYANKKEGRIKDAQGFIEDAEVVFNGMLNDAIESKKSYEDLIELYDIAELEIKLGEIMFAGFDYKGPAQQDFNVKLTIEQVIGNQEFKERGLSAVENVLSYDPNAKSNIMMPFPLFYLVTGTPGCGKTIGAMALAKRFLDLAKQYGKPAEFFVLNSAKFKSEYQNKSANELYKIFTQKIFVPDKLYFVYMPDVDTIFSSRKADGQRQEDNNILGVAFDLFDGTATPRTGHFIVMMDANYTDGMDPALLERFRKSTITCYGPQTEEDYDRLLMDVCLKKGLEKGYVKVSDQEREQIAKKLVEHKLSGRAVDSIALEIKDRANSFAKPEGWFGMTFEQQQEQIGGLYVHSDGQFIIERIDHYQNFTREQENKEFERNVQTLMERMNINEEAARRLVIKDDAAINKARDIAGGAAIESYTNQGISSAGTGSGRRWKFWKR